MLKILKFKTIHAIYMDGTPIKAFEFGSSVLTIVHTRDKNQSTFPLLDSNESKNLI